MWVVDTGVDHSYGDALTQNALLVQFAHSRGDVGGVVKRRGILAVRMNGDGRKGDFLVQPDANNILKSIEVVRVELVGGDTDTTEDLAIECANNFNSVCVANLFLALV